MNIYNKIFKNEHIFDFYFCKRFFINKVDDTFIIKCYVNQYQYNYNLNELFNIKQKITNRICRLNKRINYYENLKYKNHQYDSNNKGKIKEMKKMIIKYNYLLTIINNFQQMKDYINKRDLNRKLKQNLLCKKGDSRAVLTALKSKIIKI